MKTELRCAACGRLTPPGKFCRRCASELVEPELYGVARMLLAAGVERSALLPRLRALGADERSAFAAAYASQWTFAVRRVEEATFCEGFLLQRGWAADLEDSYARWLPYSEEQLDELREGPAGPFVDGDTAMLSRIAEESPVYETRELACISLLRVGQATDELFWEVLRTAVAGRDRVSVEAALAFGHWRVRARRLRPTERALAELAQAAQPMLHDARLGPWAACAAAWGASGARLEQLAPVLRPGLASADAELRLSCAVALAAEDVLGPALDSGDASLAALAHDILGKAGSARVTERLATGDDATRRLVLRGLEHPLVGRVLDALLKGARSSSVEFRNAALRFVQEVPFDSYEPAGRLALGRFHAGVSALFPAPALLDALHWASGGEARRGTLSGGAPLGDLQPFADAATGALSRVRPEQVAALLELRGFTRWLELVEGPGADAVLDGWLHERTSALSVLERMLAIHAQHASLSPPDGRLARRLVAAWGRAGSHRPVLAGALAEVTRRNVGLPGLRHLAAAFWERFRERPEERREIVAALKPWRRALYELRDAETPERALDGGDARRFLQIYAAAEPDALPEIMTQALSRVRGALGAFASPAMAVLEANATALPRTTLLAARQLAAAVANAVREQPSAESEKAAVALRSGVERLVEVTMFAKNVPPEEAEASLALDELEVELRLIDEAEAAAERRR